MKSWRVATLVCVALGSALLYGAALLRFPLLEIYHRPLQNLDRLTDSAPEVGLALFVAVALLFVGYGFGLFVLRQPLANRWTALLVFVPPLVFAALLLFVYPTTSLDVYDYLFRGRMAVRYGANNFVQVPADFNTDPLMASRPFRFIPWSKAVTAYGPVWEWLSYATAWLAGERPGPIAATIDPSLRALMLGYKALGALGFLLCGAAIWMALPQQQRWLGAYLWLWNPLALWESVAAGHNDSWMALAIVAAVWSMNATRTATRRGALGAFLALTIGGLTKYFALIFGPLMLAASLRRLGNWRERWRLVALGALVCGGLVVLAYAPFWQGSATLRNFGDRGTLFYASWLAAAQAWLPAFGVAKEIAQRLASAIATSLLVGGVVFSAWRGWQEPQRVAWHALQLLLWFLFVCNPWFQPWYLLWALALVALQPEKQRMVWAIVVFCATAMGSYIAGSFLLPVLGWGSESAAWNVLLSLLIYLPPLAVLAKQYVPGIRTIATNTQYAEDAA